MSAPRGDAECAWARPGCYVRGARTIPSSMLDGGQRRGVQRRAGRSATGTAEFIVSATHAIQQVNAAATGGDRPPSPSTPVRIEAGSGEIEKIEEVLLGEQGRLAYRHRALLLPAPATGDLAHCRPVQFHILLKIIDNYVCHHQSPVSARGVRRQFAIVSALPAIPVYPGQAAIVRRVSFGHQGSASRNIPRFTRPSGRAGSSPVIPANVLLQKAFYE
jgi:hypothetical protein